MRALLVTLGVAAASAASAARAQLPELPKAPVAPASSKPAGSRAEFRVSGFQVSGDRSFAFAGRVDTATGSIQGVDVLIRNKGIGIGFRSLTGTFGTQPHVTSADARIYLFPPVFSIMVGGARRALWSDLNVDSPSLVDVGLAGISSTVSIGGSGLRTHVSGAYMQAFGEEAEKVKSALEGQASVLYRLPKLPLFVEVGYRTEVFTMKAGTRETPEEVRGLKLGGGLVLGGR